MLAEGRDRKLDVPPIPFYHGLRAGRRQCRAEPVEDGEAMKRYIVEKTFLVTHQTVVYAKDEAQALKKFRTGDVEDEQKPFYEAPAGTKRGSIKVYEGSEQ